MKHQFYILDITNHNFITAQKFNASGKPRTDTLATAQKCGGKLKQIDIASFDLPKNFILRKIKRGIDMFYALAVFFVKYSKVKNCIIFIQYPFLNIKENIVFYILKKLKSQNNRLITLYHDLELLRNKYYTDLDRFMLENSDVSIVHSTNMLDEIKDRNIKIKNSICLEFFDYTSNLNLPINKDLRRIQLIYAGNLQKSTFLKSLDKVHFNESFRLNLYGLFCDIITESDFVKYKGKFDAEKFSDIDGNWGLVWDGTSIDTCDGIFGNYLRYNSPFKMSLYLAAKKPVVVWKESAMAEYVEKYKMGICVSSLNEIASRVGSLSDSDLQQIQHNVDIISEEVRAGMKLESALNIAFEELNF